MSFLSRLLGVMSGGKEFKISEQLLYDKVIGFRGVVNGVGTSTIVQNTAIALSAKTNFAICVLDTNFMFPTQYPMLVTDPDEQRTDYLDYNKDISKFTIETRYKNIYLASMYNRGLVDMLSSKDSDTTVEHMIGALKTYFDVILIDLSLEPTNISTYSAIKCNKIFNISDMSLNSIYNLKKSINTMVSLGVPLPKANKMIINKIVPDVITNIKSVITEAGIEVIGQIPMSLEVAKLGVAGKRIYEDKTSNRGIYAFSGVIDRICEEIIDQTPLNDKLTKRRTTLDDESMLEENLNVIETGNEELEFDEVTSVEDSQIEDLESDFSDNDLDNKFYESLGGSFEDLVNKPTDIKG